MYRPFIVVIFIFLLCNGLYSQIVFVADTRAALTGINAGKVMQVDFDNDGYVYVQGGDNLVGQIAGFDNGGFLKWKFAPTDPNLRYGDNFGGWAVDKLTGNVYIGRGAPVYGGPVIRINGKSGSYDNYRTSVFADVNGNIGENWKMRWFCNGNAQQILIGSGRGSYGSFNDNMGLLSLSGASFTTYNVTGNTNPPNEDVADFVVDPVNNDLYAVFTPGNRIYKNSLSYTAANPKWNTLTGYTTLREDDNAPFMAPARSVLSTNAANVLAVSTKYLFYYDGKNLKAFDKSTGATVGTPLTFTSTALMQQGIYADNCDHVYIGTDNGSIKVLLFNGSVFDDNAAADIDIPGYSGKAVYALTYDEDRNYLYAGGDGFVTAVNLSSYCASPKPPPVTYHLFVKPTKTSVTATIFPAPPANAVVSYSLVSYLGDHGTNSTGTFTNIQENVPYTMLADIIDDCHKISRYSLFKATDLEWEVKTEDVCGGKGGKITIIAKDGVPPYLYRIDGVGRFQSNNEFSDLAPGVHWAIVMDSINNFGIAIDIGFPVIINVNELTVDAGNDATVCEGVSTHLSGISNGTNFSWTPVAGISNTTIINPDASPHTTTKYYLSATKGTCTLTDSLVVTVLPAPIAHAGNDTGVCYSLNGVLHGSGGVSYAWKPDTYLSSTAIQNPEVIHPERSVLYSLQVTDAQGCRSIKDDTVLFKVVSPTRVWAGNDTIIAANQPLHLQAVDMNNSGFTQFTWSPSYGLTNAGVADPVALPENNISYQVTAVTPEGCTATDAVSVKVFKYVDAYVPNAFTPNGDGHNDVFRITAPGIKTLNYFVIMNRWGQEVFHTTNLTQGWDGSRQNTGTYVWTLEGIDYTGRIIRKKGTVELIR